MPIQSTIILLSIYKKHKTVFKITQEFNAMKIEEVNDEII